MENTNKENVFGLVALDNFQRESGLSNTTLWRYRRRGWLKTINIGGRMWLKKSEIARFEQRAESGEFSKPPVTPYRKPVGA